jgi:hypothetical protein
MRDPPIRILLNVFIREHRLKGSAMQRQIQHIFGTGQGRDKAFVDRLRPLLPDDERV